MKSPGHGFDEKFVLCYLFFRQPMKRLFSSPYKSGPTDRAHLMEGFAFEPLCSRDVLVVVERWGDISWAEHYYQEGGDTESGMVP